MEVTVRDDDRNVDFIVEVDPYCDDAGRYVEPNEVTLQSGVVWIGKHGYTFMPETNIQAKDAGAHIAARFVGEIDTAVREEIEQAKEREAAGV